MATVEIEYEIPREFDIKHVGASIQCPGIEINSVEEVAPQYFEIRYEVHFSDLDTELWEYRIATLENDFDILAEEIVDENNSTRIVWAVLHTKPIIVRGTPEFVGGFVQAYRVLE